MSNIPTMLTIKETAERSGLAEHYIRKLCLSVLTELNILKVVSKGIPAKRHFKINFEGIAIIFDKIEREKTATKPQNFKMSKILTASGKKVKLQDNEIFNTNNKIYNNINNEIDGLKDYVLDARLKKSERSELEQEFQRLEINLTDDYIKILSKIAYRRLLFMRAGVTSVFCTPHRYKLCYLDAKKLITLFDKYAEFEEKTGINEPVRYFKKMLLEYLDEQVTV